MAQRLVVVIADRDDEAGVWYVESSTLFGVNAEGETLEELIGKLPMIVRDLLEVGGESEGGDVSIELIARTRAEMSSAA